MGKRSIMIDFYRAKVQGISGGLTKVFEEAKKQNPTRLTQTAFRDPIRLETLDRTVTGQWIGHLVKIRMDIRREFLLWQCVYSCDYNLWIIRFARTSQSGCALYIFTSEVAGMWQRVNMRRMYSQNSS